MAQSSIEWTEKTWNPTTGCNKLSAGCKFCYAEVMSRRLKAMGMKKYHNGFRITTHADALNIPYTWRRPATVFVNSMSDLFHAEVPLEFIQRVFAVMNDTPQHTYQVLTKRPELVLQYNNKLNWTPNIWMGTSVEDSRVTHRIDALRRTSAHTKFLSLEPLLGPLHNLNLDLIDWAIVGGESGHGARPVKWQWIYDIKLQCQEAGVAFFFKQWGKPHFNINQKDPTIDVAHPQHAKGGCMLFNNIYREMPVTV